MRTICFLFLAGLLLFSSSVSYSSQDSSELKEAATLTEDALKLFNERKYDEALSKTKKALEIRERLLPRTDPRILNSLVYLGDVYIVKRDFDDAKKVLERAEGILAERSGADNVSRALIWDRLAIIYDKKGDDRKAEELYQQALTAREKSFGPEDRRVAHSLFALGEFYRSKKDFERAAPIYKRALAIYGKLSGIKSADFERTSDGFICLVFENDKQDINLRELTEIRKRLAPSSSDSDIPNLNGRALTMPKPLYPREARERRLSGIVVVKVTVDENGEVISARDLCQGPPYLSEASVNAARLARFAPTLDAGKPVKVTGVMRYKYVAQ